TAGRPARGARPSLPLRRRLTSHPHTRGRIMAVKLLVSGWPEPAGIAIERSATGSATAVGGGELLASVEVVQAFDLSPAARTAASAAPAIAEVSDDDILEIQVEDGFTLWTSAAHYAERVQALDPDAAQDGSIAFSSV